MVSLTSGNGVGTTGGAAASSVTTVSTLSALQAAASGTAAAIIHITGTITGNAVVNVGSNKSILGKSSAACKLIFNRNKQIGIVRYTDITNSFGRYWSSCQRTDKCHYQELEDFQGSCRYR